MLMTHRAGERGNILYYLLIAIALFGALSFAISQSGRSTLSTLTEDQRRLAATEILAFSDAVSQAVTQLRLRGTELTALSFATTFLSAAEYGTYDTDPDNEVFNLSGGGVIYQEPPADALTITGEQYEFLNSNVVQNIGTTCTAASCADLVMALPNVKQEVCILLNELLGVDNPSDVPPTETNIDDTAFKADPAPFGYMATISDEDATLDGRKEACFEETGGSAYFYYKVLIPR